jgi:hypothetical protein
MHALELLLANDLYSSAINNFVFRASPKVEPEKAFYRSHHHMLWI